jgi:hypothetical protein
MPIDARPVHVVDAELGVPGVTEPNRSIFNAAESRAWI